MDFGEGNHSRLTLHQSEKGIRDGLLVVMTLFGIVSSEMLGDIITVTLLGLPAVISFRTTTGQNTL